MTPRTKAQRFPILISPMWRLLLRPFGVAPGTSFAEVDDRKLRVRFGRFDYRFLLEDIESVSRSHWPLWAGIGPRYFRGAAGLVGTYVNTVEVRFKEPQPIRMLLPLRCERLFLSMEEPSDLIAALSKKPEVEARAA